MTEPGGYNPYGISSFNATNAMMPAPGQIAPAQVQEPEAPTSRELMQRLEQPNLGWVDLQKILTQLATNFGPEGTAVVDRLTAEKAAALGFPEVTSKGQLDEFLKEQTPGFWGGMGRSALHGGSAQFYPEIMQEVVERIPGGYGELPEEPTIGPEYTSGPEGLYRQQRDAAAEEAEGPPWLQRLQGDPDRLQDLRPLLEAKQDLYREEHPVAAFTGELGGALVGPGRVGLGGLGAGSWLPRIAGASGVAGVEGLLYGMGEGDGGVGERMEQGWPIAAISAALGPLALGMPQAAKLVKRGLNRVAGELPERASKFLREIPAGVSDMAESTMDIFRNMTPIAGRKGGRELADVVEGLPPTGLPGDVPELQPAVGFAGTSSPTAAREMNETFRQRVYGHARRFEEAVRRAFNLEPGVGSPAQRKAQREVETRMLGQDLYGALDERYPKMLYPDAKPIVDLEGRRLTGKVVPVEQFQRVEAAGIDVNKLMDRVPDDVWTRARSNAAVDGHTFDPEVLGFKELHYVLRQLRSTARNLIDSRTTSADKDLGARLHNLADDYENFMDKLIPDTDIPGFGSVQQAYRKAKNAERAIDYAEDFWKKNIDVRDIREWMLHADAEAIRLFREGVGDEAMEAARNTSRNRNPQQAVFNANRVEELSAAMRDKIDIGTGGGARMRELFDELDQLDIERRTLDANPIRGSRTELNKEGVAAAMVTTAGRIASQGPTRIPQRAISEGWNRLTGGAKRVATRQAVAADELADLVTTDPARAAQIIRELYPGFNIRGLLEESVALPGLIQARTPEEGR